MIKASFDIALVCGYGDGRRRLSTKDLASWRSCRCSSAGQPVALDDAPCRRSPQGWLRSAGDLPVNCLARATGRSGQ
jgi:hypothetical protein